MLEVILFLIDVVLIWGLASMIIEDIKYINGNE